MEFLSALRKKFGKDSGAAQKMPVGETAVAVRVENPAPGGTAGTPTPSRPRLAAHLLLQAHVTEKTAALTGSGRYTFRVSPRATKCGVRHAVEELYGVKVANVRVITIHPKNRTTGRFRGSKSGYRKAVVRLQKGQVIAEFLQQ